MRPTNDRAIVLLVGWAIFCAAVPVVPAQDTPDSFSIRVESNQVLVPTYVFYKDRMTVISPKRSRCDSTNDATYTKLHADEAYIPSDCDDTAIRGLSAEDFHISEDGVEQKIQRLTFEPDPATDARDNFGSHMEHSDTPRGKWSTTEAPQGFSSGSVSYFYRIAYVPPKSEKGSCHRVDVKVARPNTAVYARSQYCNLEESPDDLLSGTPFDKILESHAASGKEAKIALSLQAGFVFTGENAARTDVVLEFPWDSLKRQWSRGNLHATIGVLGLVYHKDGTLAARFSDFGCCSSDEPQFVSTDGPQMNAYPGLDIALIPARYETQVDLRSGEYTLLLILSDGSKFGSAETPLSIESYDGKSLAISSVMLCKRFRNAAVAAEEAAAVNLAPQYVPLVSKGVQFTPTADTRFRKGEPLAAYFEVYEPQLAGNSATVNTQLKITDVKTGQVKVDTGPRSAADWIQPGKSTIPIAEQIDVAKLPAGSYRLEVQATDSAGKSTAWRAANFTVE